MKNVVNCPSSGHQSRPDNNCLLPHVAPNSATGKGVIIFNASSAGVTDFGEWDLNNRCETSSNSFTNIRIAGMTSYAASK